MYHESERPGFFYLLLVILVIWVFWIAYSFTWFFDDSIGELHRIATVFVFIIVGAYLAWITLVVSSYQVYYDGENLTIGYFGWNVTLANLEIIDAVKVDINWIKWGGQGWRLKGLKKIGYITKSGAGIELLSRRKKRSYTFNCRDPDALLMAFEKRGVIPVHDSADSRSDGDSSVQ